MNRTKGLLALTSSALILGTAGVLIREMAKSFSNAGQVFARSFFALLIILVIVYFNTSILESPPVRAREEVIPMSFLFGIKCEIDEIHPFAPLCLSL